MEQMTNCHVHLFTDKDIPRKFLPLGLVRILASKVGFRLVAKVLNWLNPFTSNDQFDRYVQFIEVGRLGSQKKIFENIQKEYPQLTKFFCLSMDMAFMGAGDVPNNYKNQIDELTKVSEFAIPVYHCDPRRENYWNLFLYAMNIGFKALKIYPPLGVFPYDKRLYPVYEYCQTNNIPVMCHTTAGSPVHFKGSYKELKALLRDCQFQIDWSRSDADLCSYFTEPRGWETILKEFPSLRVCLCHWGRQGQFDEQTKALMQKYPNVYVDISYSLGNPENWGNLKVKLNTDLHFRERVLYGSDYYMLITECEEKQMSINLRAYLDEILWHQIATVNPERFLLG
jgi:predicted TIM-barrel fold metal-dependent hydrolase